MTLGEKIATLRKNKSITQEALAQQLGVTNQAVSKWESDQCCPDVMLLPKLADIFGISLDALFGRSVPSVPDCSLPWPDDGTVRAVVFVGRQLVDGHPVEKELTFQYEGPALNIHSAFSVTCEDVDGNIQAGGSIQCGDVDGNVQAGGNVNCEDIGGDLKTGGNVTCGDVGGDVTAGADVSCADVGGSVTASGMASCAHAGGRINSGKDAMKAMWKDMFPSE